MSIFHLVEEQMKGCSRSSCRNLTAQKKVLWELIGKCNHATKQLLDNIRKLNRERNPCCCVWPLSVIHSKTICGEPQLRNKITDECLFSANALRLYCASNL